MKDKGMMINVNKSKVLQITKNKEERRQCMIKMNGENLEFVDQYKYLGTIFSNNGKINEEIKNRIKLTTNVYYQLNRTIIGKPEISRETKLQIYKTIYTPILLYGSESWPINTKVKKQIETTEMKYLRRVVNKTRRDRERNTNIRQELGVTPLENQIERKQLKWFGHVSRMESKRLPRKCLETRMEGRRSKGRPRTKWIDSVKSAGEKRQKTMSEMKVMLTDRKEWKKWVEKDPTP